MIIIIVDIIIIIIIYFFIYIRNITLQILSGPSCIKLIKWIIQI